VILKLTSNQPMFAFVSTVDGQTNDSTVFELQRPSTESASKVGVVASTGGIGASWKTSLWIGGGVECAEPSRLEIQEVTSGGHHVEVDFGVELSAALENAGRVVPQSLEMEVFGFFRLHQNCDRVSHLRIFNDQGEDGTYGQGVPLISGHQVLAPGRPGWFPGAVETGEQRTNIGFINPSATTASVRIGVFDLAGSEVGASIVEVPARSIVQVNRYLREFSDLLTEGRATVQVTVESGAGVLAYDSRVFARTGDPVFRWADPR
jgi:hypothetical protein